VLRYTEHYPPVRVIAWEPAGNLIATGDAGQTIHIWDASSGNTRLQYSGLAPQYTFNAVFALAWSPDAHYLASGSDDGIIQVWETSNGNTRYIYRGYQQEINSLSWSPDQRRIASVSNGKIGALRTWNAFTGDDERIFQLDVATDVVAWSPNARYLACGCRDRRIRIWNSTNGKLEKVLTGHYGRISSLSWSPDSTKLVSASESDQRVLVWEALSEQVLYIYHKHTQGVRTVAWSPDGLSIASAGNDQEVHIWQTA
jgi:WD40 repeat protein